MTTHPRPLRGHRTSASIQRSRAGLTLLEFVISGVVLSVGCAVLMPAVLWARTSADRHACAERLKSLGQAMHGYEQLHGGLPPRRIFGPYRGWAPPLLPHLGQGELAKKYRMDKDFYDPLNREVIGTRLTVFECPAAPPARTITVTDLASNETGSVGAVSDFFAFNSVSDPAVPTELRSNKNTAMADETIRPLSEIPDGISFTLLLTEQAGRPDYWVKGAKQPTNAGLAVPQFWGPWASFNAFQLVSYTADGMKKRGPCVINCNNSQGVYSFHPDGANGLFVDGSVRFLGTKLAPEVLFGLVTRNGGEVVEEGDLQ